MILIIFAIVCILIILLNLALTNVKTEHFMSFNVGTRMACPTRNQSYDLRGEAAIIPRTELPTNNSGFGPLDPSACPHNGVQIL